MTDTVIETERLVLRKWRKKDFLPFAEMNASPEVMEFFPQTLSASQSRVSLDRIEDHFKQHGFGLYALEKKEDGNFIGFTGFMIPQFESFFTPCVEIGWRLIKSAWGRGFATEAAGACLRFGFEKFQFNEVYSFTSLLNKRSVHVMEKLEMNKVGQFNHPMVPLISSLCLHVLYRMKKEDISHCSWHSKNQN